MVIHWICDHKFEYTKVSDLASRWMLVKLLGYNVACCYWSGKEFFNPFFLLKESSRLQPFNLKGVHLMAKNLAAWRIFHSLSLSFSLGLLSIIPPHFLTLSVSPPTSRTDSNSSHTHPIIYFPSLSMWPDLATFRHLCNTLKLLGQFLVQLILYFAELFAYT